MNDMMTSLDITTVVVYQYVVLVLEQLIPLVTNFDTWRARNNVRAARALIDRKVTRTVPLEVLTRLYYYWTGHAQ